MKKIRALKLEVTHLCNRNCKLCDHRIHTSNFKELTKEGYKKLVECMKGYEMGHIKLTGGEPLSYPHIHWIIKELKKDFPGVPLILQTNGDNLDNLNEEELNSFKRIEISKYSDPSNQEIIDKYKHRKNILIQDSTEMWDPYVDPNFDYKTAMKYYKICAHVEPRFVGTKVYGCCQAEGIERWYKTDKIHFEIHPNWLEDFKKIPNWKACQHCFHAHVMHTRWKMRMRHRIAKFIRDHNTIFEIFKKLKLKFFKLGEFKLGWGRV